MNVIKKLGGCATGDAVLSPGFQLPAKWIIHTVGPVWQGGNKNEPSLLESCYRRCFKLALEKELQSIAFPAISTCVYGYPKQAASETAVRVMHIHEPEFDRIIACCFSEEDAALYKRLL